MEITESLIMKDVNENIEKPKAIRVLGAGISIDDFGTGNALKIDRSFIINMANNPDHRNIVSAIISLAHLLKHEVVAEGVDSGEQVRLLREMGCDGIQGDIFSQPLPAERFQVWRRNFVLEPG